MKEKGRKSACAVEQGELPVSKRKAKLLSQKTKCKNYFHLGKKIRPPLKMMTIFLVCVKSIEKDS